MIIKFDEYKNNDISTLTDDVFYMFLEEGKIYLQHYYNQNMPEYFKDIMWYWNKDTTFIKNNNVEKKLAANKKYKNVKDWLFYCGGRNGSLWLPKYA